MATHVKTLGILHIVFGVIGVMSGLFVLALMAGVGALVGIAAEGDAGVVIPILGAVGVFVLFIAVALSLPGIIIGWGLLGFRNWARICGIILSALELLSVPFGTILGVYGLWVLLSNGSERLFESQDAPRHPVRA